MSEETNNNEGSWGSLKKTIIATLTTVITGGGVWISTQLFGGGVDSVETTVKQSEQQVSPTSQPATPVVINLTQTQENTQQQKAGGNTTTIIREVEKPVEKKVEKEEDFW